MLVARGKTHAVAARIGARRSPREVARQLACSTSPIALQSSAYSVETPSAHGVMIIPMLFR